MIWEVITHIPADMGNIASILIVGGMEYWVVMPQNRKDEN